MGGSDNGPMGGMDMGGDNSSTSGEMSMAMYFHHSLTDFLWFHAFKPSSPGAVFGACVLLFFLSIIFRFLQVIRIQVENAWVAQPAGFHRAQEGNTSTDENFESPKDTSRISLPLAGSLRRTSRTPPFIFQREAVRAVFQFFQAGLGWFLMLAVMTYNVYFLIAVLLGAATGEFVFGRFASPQSYGLDTSGCH